MVGYEIARNEFIRRLEAEEKRLVKLAVDGPGGSGKTTLVKNVFWKPQIQARFDCHAWISVSKRLDVEKICQNLLKQLCSSRREPYPPDDGLPLHTRLRNYLVGKSRVIVTTTCSNVSAMCDHKTSLLGLESSDAWKLFCSKAFPGINGECPLELKDASIKIVKRCEGDSLQYNALQRSYIDLSSSLKCCLLYMAIFPEDYTVERGRLIRLWVAEGLATAPAARDKTAEEVAEGYLTELIRRNLIQVSNSDFHGRPTNCRVQNLVLKFIIQKCNDDNFASIFDHDQIQIIKNIEGGQMIRRLSIQNQFKHLEENGDFTGVRSMFLLRLPKIRSSDFEKNLGKLKLIKVMDVQGAPLTEFPKEITRFTLMRYLSFRDTNIQTIPSSIEKLSYLETLDLKQTAVTQLPKEISHLHNLCHLLVYKKNDHHVALDSVQGVKLHKAGIRKLEKLQNLSLVKVDPKGDILKDLKQMIQLRKLGITGLRWEHSKDLCAAVELMEKLTTLNLSSATMQEFMELEWLTNRPPKTLERLYLNGLLKAFPSWISKMDNLIRIHLKWSGLENFPLEDLEKLPKLTELHMVDCYTGLELVFGVSGFKKLKILVVEKLKNVCTIVIQNGAMAELKQMSLRGCRQMRMLLGGENLVGVEELTLHDMDEEFIACFRNNGGEYGDWVRKIPLVHSFIRDERENLSDFVSF
ncbi:hypothetical protein C2S52_005790 [Perilla frutescens var. hirtella]|nr:hypothetical protein C2S52_005790 [Perilla frutescens var. hirtella]